MPAPFTEWKVLPHGELRQVDQDILTVTGRIHMPLTDLPRSMTVVRLRDRRLVIWSAIALDPSEMDALETFGTPSFLVVPSDHHRLDAKIWKDRYPALQVIAPPGARDKVEELLTVDATHGDFDDPAVTFLCVPGTDRREAALVISSPDGTTLLLSDLVANVRNAHGLQGWILRMMGFAGDHPQIPKPMKAGVIDDASAVRDMLLEWSQLPSLRRILVSHGDPIDERPDDALRALAASLS
jgi:hypothetical protein